MNDQEKQQEKEAREKAEREQKEREAKEKAEKEKKDAQEKAEKEKAEREKKDRDDKEKREKDEHQKSEREKSEKAIKENVEREQKALKEAHDKESERVKNLQQPHGAGKGPHKPEQNPSYRAYIARDTGSGMTGYRSDMLTREQNAALRQQWQTHAAKNGRDSGERSWDNRDGPQADGVAADRGGPDRPGPAPTHAHVASKPWHEKHGGHPDHLSTILTDKAHAAVEGEKPWNRQHADPDRAEARMAAQARAREQER